MGQLSQALKEFKEGLGWKEVGTMVLAFVLAVAGATYCAVIERNENQIPLVITPVPFMPIETNALVLLNEGPFSEGELIIVQNGMCNASKEGINGVWSFGIQPSPATIVQPPINFVKDREVNLPPGACLGRDAYRIPVAGESISIAPGNWRFFLRATFKGNQAGQEQGITLFSPPFEVQQGGPE
jgi:hypothetical protein